MNIQIDGYNFLTILISLFSAFFTYYSLIANRPRIFLKAVYVNNNVNKNDLPNFDRNFNLKFINYGDKPAFNVKLIYEKKNYIKDFLRVVYKLEKDIESGKKSFDKNLDKSERDFFQAIVVAKLNSIGLFKKNQKYLHELMQNEIAFIDGKSYELKNLGIGNQVSKGGLKDKKHSFYAEYQDLRDLNIFVSSFLSLVHIHIYLLYSLYGLVSFLPFTFACISNETGFFFSISEDKYKRTFKEKMEINIQSQNTYFEYDELLNKLDTINESINKKNVFDEQIYAIWEKNLTKSEYKIFKKYRFQYGDNVQDYVELYKKRHTELPKNIGLHSKLWDLLGIFHSKNAIKRTTYVGLDILRHLP